MKNTALKSGPKPVRFGVEEEAFLNAAANATGMSVSELVRRSVRLMRRQQEVFNGYGFILELSR